MQLHHTNTENGKDTVTFFHEGTLHETERRDWKHAIHPDGTEDISSLVSPVMHTEDGREMVTTISAHGGVQAQATFEALVADKNHLAEIRKEVESKGGRWHPEDLIPKAYPYTEPVESPVPPPLPVQTAPQTTRARVAGSGLSQ